MNRRRFALMGLSLLGGLASPAGGRETGPVHGQLKWDPAFLALSAEEKRPWERWFSQSDRLRQKEIALLAEEVARVRGHRARPAREGISFQVPAKPEAWFAGAEARRIAEALLSWQAPCGDEEYGHDSPAPRPGAALVTVGGVGLCGHDR